MSRCQGKVYQAKDGGKDYKKITKKKIKVKKIMVKK